MKNRISIAASFVLALAATTAFAHAKLQNSTPANGATVTSAPSELRFEYNEAVEPAMSSVKVIGPDGKSVAAEKAEVSKDSEKVLLVKVPVLSPGTYRVDWSTMGHDGHHTKGTVNFTVK